MLAAVAIVALVLLSLIARWRNGRAPAAAPQAPTQVGPPQLYVLASQMYRHYEESAQPADLLQHAEFQQGVALFNGGPYSVPDLLAYYSGDNILLACMALEALSRRRDKIPDIGGDILPVISSVAPWARWFALRVLRAHVPMSQSIVGPMLLRADSFWTSRIALQFLREFVAERAAAGAPMTFGDGLKRVSEEQAKLVRNLLQQLGEPLVGNLLRELDDWERTRIDTVFLASVGRVWGASEADDCPPVIEHAALQSCLLELESALATGEPRSVLLVGESGVGKTTAVRVLARRLQAAGWVIFEAGAPELLAGQAYIGELEGRLRSLVKQVGGKKRVLWVIPGFHALLWAGRTRQNETSVLDLLLPHVEQGNIVVLGETQPSAYERLTTLKPRCLTAFLTCRIEPLPDAATLELARAWVLRHSPADPPALLSEATLREAWQLAQQYLGDQAAPGSLLDFLDQTRKRLAGGDRSGPSQIHIDDLIVTLTQRTGLPESILDDRHNLELGALRQLFEKRVLGQQEAVDCLVERVAMIKAGVTDPTRPQGVFLFAGPTGTGKTEIAKTLAEFLFGAPNRMIRLDMSELQTPESLSRLLGGLDGTTEGALVDLIRKQPFSVVLLDEFEKAHANVWDVFLQVFDDGRLTDRAGNATDFRHAIIIMTSNLGGVIPSGTALGFARAGERFRPDIVERAIAQAFRREFLNRIDRVVVFAPLGRDTMRQILVKELDEVTRRRGLRNRSWAIEWDDEAIEFLLARGFTADLGARPLKRAIERYVLSPLAITIVEHRFPEGDQFLFVKVENDKLGVQLLSWDDHAALPRGFPA